VPELVQGRTAGSPGEQGRGLLITEPGMAVLVEIGGRELNTAFVSVTNSGPSLRPSGAANRRGLPYGGSSRFHGGSSRW
jgi:hypothetical protein